MHETYSFPRFRTLQNYIIHAAAMRQPYTCDIVIHSFLHALQYTLLYIYSSSCNNITNIIAKRSKMYIRILSNYDIRLLYNVLAG